MSHTLFLEDLFVGQTFTSATYTMDGAEIIQFASQYDPQPFHTSPEEAEQLFFKGHSASGWHTAAVSMRLFTQSIPMGCGLIGIGAELTWLKPVRPGDVLHTVTEVMHIQVSQSKPDRAVVNLRAETINQHNEVVQRMAPKILVLSKNATL